jgi:hypothetical protein
LLDAVWFAVRRPMKSTLTLGAVSAAVLIAGAASGQTLNDIREVTIVEARDSTVRECRIGTDKMRQAMQSVFEAAGLVVRPALEGPVVDADGAVRQPIRVRMGNFASYDRRRDLCYGYLEFQMVEHTGLTSARLAAAGNGRAFGDVELAQARITGAFAPGDYQRLVWSDVFATLKHVAAMIGRGPKS